MTKEKLQFFVQGNRHVCLPPSCLNHHLTKSLGFSLLREKQGRRPKLFYACLDFEVCETWTVCKRHANELNRFHLNCLPFNGSTKTWNLESGNGNGITETETEYAICERRFQAIDLKKIILAMTMK